MERMCINQRYIHSLHLFRVFASAQSQGRECAVTGPRVRSHKIASARSLLHIHSLHSCRHSGKHLVGYGAYSI